MKTVIPSLLAALVISAGSSLQAGFGDDGGLLSLYDQLAVNEMQRSVDPKKQAYARQLLAADQAARLAFESSPEYQARQEREDRERIEELEYEIEALQAQQAQQRRQQQQVIITGGVSRDVQVASPGGIIDLRR